MKVKTQIIDTIQNIIYKYLFQWWFSTVANGSPKIAQTSLWIAKLAHFFNLTALVDPLQSTDCISKKTVTKSVISQKWLNISLQNVTGLFKSSVCTNCKNEMNSLNLYRLQNYVTAYKLFVRHCSFHPHILLPMHPVYCKSKYKKWWHNCCTTKDWNAKMQSEMCRYVHRINIGAMCNQQLNHVLMPRVGGVKQWSPSFLVSCFNGGTSLHYSIKHTHHYKAVSRTHTSAKDNTHLQFASYWHIQNGYQLANLNRINPKI